MASSEEVLLVVNHVRHKKRDGTLYLMAERIGWMEKSREMFSISRLYTDVKMQKISPEGKSKVQLQLILHDGSACTFHFANPESTMGLKDRNDVKELLQQLLPKFKSKANRELEEKNRMLQEDPELFQLYKDLVVSGVISADEFWSSRTAKQGSSQSTQDVGVSAAFLADIKPQTDGCNGLKYNLTADIIESIFRTYPAVKKKHAENVPDQMSESEFWTRFFQSHYFHRDRITTGNKDLFTDCAKSDDKEMKKIVNKKIKDPLLDLTSLDDQVLDEGYGVKRKDPKSFSSTTNSNLIKRFNLHNSRVLSISEKSSANSQSSANEVSTSKNSTPVNNTGKLFTNGANNVSSSDKNCQLQQDTLPQKRKRIQEAIEYEDLATKKTPQAVVLNLDKAERYHHGPLPINVMNYATSDEILLATQALTTDLSQTRSMLVQAIHPSVAGSVVSELSPGGALMHGHSQQPLHLLYSGETQSELKHLYSALCELLRHFWSCFPVSSKFLEDKVTRMKINLERFQAAKLQPFKDKLTSEHINTSVVNHMEELLETAFGKFTSWQAKKSGLAR